MLNTSATRINRSTTADPGKKPRPTGPLLDWFYVHAGYMNEDGGTPVVWDAPRGVEIEVRPGEKTDRIIAPDQSWERTGISHLWRVYHWNDGYRLHYRSGDRHLIAESKDGFNWTKPEFGAVEFEGSTKNNIIAGSGEHYFEDPSAPPEERFKLIGMKGGLYDAERNSDGNFVPYEGTSEKAKALIAEGGDAGAVDTFDLQESPATRMTFRDKWVQLKGFLVGSVSADGIHFKELEKPFLPEWVDGDNLISYNEELGKYVGYLRFHLAGRRCVGISYSDDFRTFTPEQVVLQIDSADPPEDSFYNHSYTRYPGRSDLHAMFVSIFHQDTGLIDIQLAVSHDGLRWDRPNRTRPIIPNGPDGSPDSGCIYVAPDLLELPDGRYAIAYSGRLKRHIEGVGEDTDDIYQQGIIRYATWERDRLVGIRARQLGSFTLRQDRYRRPEDCPDSIEVPPFDRFPPVADPNEPPRQLRLNYRCEMGGWIRTELIPVIGPMTHPQIDALEGYGFADCDTMDGDEIDKVVTWKGKDNIACLSDTMAVRIEMYRTTLFSFSL